MIEDKKGTELAWQTIVVFIILLIVMIVVIMFFVEHYGSNSTGLMNISNSAINGVRN